MGEPIRILHVLQRMEAAGTQALLMNLYRAIDRTKVQFDFLVEYPDKQFHDDEIVKMGGRIYYTTVRVDFNVPKFMRQVEKILSEHPEYKIIHVHAYSIGYFVLKVAHKHGIPVRIAHSHNNETMHDIKWIPKLMMQRLYTIHANDLFACSKEAGNYLFHSKRFHVLNNAIKTEIFIADMDVRREMREELCLGDCFTVGHVGRFHSQKNHTLLIRAFAECKKRIPDAKLILVGSGELENDIRRQIDELGLTKDVLFLGNRSDMNRIYQAMDVFALPSLFEGLGIVAIEAQASGIPCVVSAQVSRNADVSPLVKYMHDGADAEEWAEAIIGQKEHEFAHTNTQQYIIDAGFDVSSTAKKMQNYYLRKMKKINMK